MASDVYSAISAQAAPAQQNPREQCMNLLKQHGIQIPDGMANNPSAIIQHLVQSGAVPQGRLNMAQQIMQRMFRR